MRTIIVRYLKRAPLVYSVLKKLYGRYSAWLLKLHKRYSEIKLAYYKHYAKRILSSRTIVQNGASDCEIHMLLCERDVLSAVWCLKSFYYFSGLPAKLFIHDDGTLTDESMRVLKNHFTGCDIILKKEADALVEKFLYKYEFCAKYRFGNSKPMSILSVRLFDFIIYSRTNKILMLDADLLFFKNPHMLVKCINSGKGCFMSDYQTAYSLTLEELKYLFNTGIMDRINNGLVYVPNKKFYDFDLLESLFKIIDAKNLLTYCWVEQTALALLVSKNKELFIRLPDAYQISRQSIKSTTISQHFVNDGFRENFYTEGLKQLKNSGFLRAVGSG